MTSLRNLRKRRTCPELAQAQQGTGGTGGLWAAGISAHGNRPGSKEAALGVFGPTRKDAAFPRRAVPDQIHAQFFIEQTPQMITGADPLMDPTGLALQNLATKAEDTRAS